MIFLISEHVGDDQTKVTSFIDKLRALWKKLEPETPESRGTGQGEGLKGIKWRLTENRDVSIVQEVQPPREVFTDGLEECD